jgi:tetratricopeptide (TPR) repeat protein
MADGVSGTYGLAWFGLGASLGLTVALLLRQFAADWLASVNAWVPRAAVAAIAVLSIAGLAGKPKTAAGPAPMAANPMGGAAPHVNGAATGAPAGSMADATAALAARLGAGGGSDADWQLLAQSYDFLNRPDDAKLAREHKVAAQRSLQDSVAASAAMLGNAVPLAGGTAAVSAGPQAKTAALLARAEDHRRKREFKQACDAYKELVAAGGMTADAWADYADALASASPNGTLSGAPAEAIAKSLAMDPKHTKGLWLKASLAHEERRYQEALQTWQTLLTLIPPQSSDARIVEANIAEAKRLAAESKG